MIEAAKRRILVVDDEIKVCQSIRQALLSDLYDIETALNGEQALRKDEIAAHEIVIVDLMMPGLSGIELLQALRSKNPRAKVIMITGYPTTRNALQSLQLGAFDYLPKPFLPCDLRNAVVRALAAIDNEKAEGPAGL